MPARTGKSYVDVGRKHRVTMSKTSLRMLSMRGVCVLRHQTGAQYSAVEWTKKGAEIRNVLASASHPDPAIRLNSASRMESFLHKVSRWWRKVSKLSSFTLRYVGTGQNGSRLSLCKH